MDDELEGGVEDLQLVEIQELLAEHGIELGETEITDLARFVREAGGLEAALELLQQVTDQHEAA